MSNPWSSFLSLLPSKQRWVGKIQSINTTTGRVAVTVEDRTDLPTVYVTGDAVSSYNVDDYVFIEGDVIVSKAPNLKAITTETIL